MTLPSNPSEIRINTKGYAGVSGSALMEATGLEKGGIYRHFESKEAVEADDTAPALAAQSRRP